MTQELNRNEFLKKVFDFEQNDEWKFAGDRPCIVDFYADWCQPCQMLAPVLDELAREYDGKIDIYKVNTGIERELAAAFGIRSIPTMLFIPVEGKPQIVSGVLPKRTLQAAIESLLGMPAS